MGRFSVFLYVQIVTCTQQYRLYKHLNSLFFSVLLRCFCWYVFPLCHTCYEALFYSLHVKHFIHLFCLILEVASKDILKSFIQIDTGTQDKMRWTHTHICIHVHAQIQHICTHAAVTGAHQHIYITGSHYQCSSHHYFCCKSYYQPTLICYLHGTLDAINKNTPNLLDNGALFQAFFSSLCFQLTLAAVAGAAAVLVVVSMTPAAFALQKIVWCPFNEASTGLFQGRVGTNLRASLCLQAPTTILQYTS